MPDDAGQFVESEKGKLRVLPVCLPVRPTPSLFDCFSRRRQFVYFRD